MTSEIPAIVDVRVPTATAPSGAQAWLRGIGVRQVRIACGLVMFSYLFSHFANHALGVISYATMETWLVTHIAFWRLLPVTIVLYSAAVVHMLLGFWALYARRHFRYTVAESLQLVLGLSIPLLLAAHSSVVHMSVLVLGRDPPNYATALLTYWVGRPYMVWVQYVLLIVAWTHACIGLYYWLRLKPFFKKAWPLLLAVAVVLPALAMSGTNHGARETIQLAKDPQWRAANTRPIPPQPRAMLEDLTLFYFPIGYGIALALVFVARGVRAVRERRGGTIKVSYPDRHVNIPKGLSVLEASLRFNVPHASVCGGRARCSTCRVRVFGEPAGLPVPSGREAFILGRVGLGGDPANRLACQLRPHRDVAVVPLLPHDIDVAFARNRGRLHIGEEHYVVSMFVDMRGSTKLAETRLPFDIIFLINRFLAAASQAVIEAGGQSNQFVGDGMLALFGLDTDPATACRQALRAAANISANIAQINAQLAAELHEPLGFGVGIHGGEVIIGDIGFRDHTVFTAIGDAVNVAARLQDMTKSLDCTVVVSQEVFDTAGVRAEALPRSDVAIRGRDEPIAVRLVADRAVLATLNDAAPSAASAAAS
jgi:adenylate cyclase